MIRRNVYTFCEQNKIETPFNTFKEIAGRKWLSLFLKRHPNVAKRRTQSMNPGRAANVHKFIFNNCYDKLKNVTTQLDIFDKPRLIFNMDKKGSRLSLHKQKLVYTKKGSKRVSFLFSLFHVETRWTKSYPSDQWFSSKGKKLQPEWQNTLPPGMMIEVTEKGSMITSTTNHKAMLCRYLMEQNLTWTQVSSSRLTFTELHSSVFLSTKHASCSLWINLSLRLLNNTGT